MKYYLLLLLFCLVTTSCMNGEQTTGSAEKELEKLLADFLEGASENNEQMHDRFWAEDLIYTSSAGERFGREDILAGFGADNEENSEDEPAPQYGYEDLQIMVFDDAAVVAFQLVGTVGTGESLQVMNYYNTGTFVNRNNQWRAVAWQATRIPE